ncbi:MAG: phosphate-starvation-inducible PsiE family protein [Nitrospirales bacterium]
MKFIYSDSTALRRSFAIDMTQFWLQGVKFILSLLILTILTALAGGVLMTFVGLELLFSQPLEVVLRQVIINTLILLAIVEVLKTTLTYFSEGRVKVTFIVDTILVVMLTEVISQWFKEAHLTQWAILGGIILTLAFTRVVAVQWSLTKTETGQDLANAESTT